MKTEEVLEALGSNAAGITEEEAERRFALFGPNEIQDYQTTGVLRTLLNQFRSPLILILMGAGVITFFLQEWIDAGVIVAAVIINTALGFYQETKAENALEALRSYIRTRSRVKRGGNERELDAKNLVPGDIIRVSQGDRVPADARLFFSDDLEVDESVLTGESLPTRKDPKELSASVPPAERVSMIFSGTLVVQGFGDAVVTRTGSETEFGRIASLIKSREREKTPLGRALERFTIYSGLILGIFVAALFGLGVASGYTVFEMFLIGVAVAVSTVPEGLPIAFTVILAVGVERLAKKRGVVRRLLAAETLGSTSVILTDKTGTLTQAKMEMASVIPFGTKTEQEVIEAALLNTDVVIENPNENPRLWSMFGRPLEVALVRGAAQHGIALSSFFSEHIILDRLPFNSRLKFSAVVGTRKEETLLTVLGAPDIISAYCDLSSKERDDIHAEIDRGAREGMRMLGAARKSFPKKQLALEDANDIAHLTFLGLIAFHDPLRPTVADTIRRIERAGVKTIIVTGDHQGTAEAVARELGLIDGTGAVLTGSDLAFLTKEELLSRADAVTVYARVTPEQKMMLVNLYREKGEIVAVTGDGVNDAPALQHADIGIAVGSGTDVAKNAADLVILDDNFETIVTAIEEGRKIIDNVRKAIVYLLSNSFDELLLIGGSLVFGLALPLNPLQILFVNFFSDSFPGVGFAFETGVDGLGSKPRQLAKNLFDREMQILILVIGFFTSALLFGLYYALLLWNFDPPLVRSFIFATFATYSLVLAFSLRSIEKSIFSFNPFSNLYLSGGVAFGLFLTAMAIYTPFLQRVLETVPLPPLWIIGVLGVGLLNIAAVESGKLLFRHRRKHTIA